MKWVLLLHAGATLMMAGVIWIIQIVHYPLFDRVGGETYIAYQSGHMALITLVVLPLMLAEALTGLLIAISPPPGIPAWAAWVGLGLIGVVWFMTMFINAPQHGMLARGFDPAIHAALVASNWIRTLAWSARGALVLWMTAALMR
jgi:hypothetical protein